MNAIITEGGADAVEAIITSPFFWLFLAAVVVLCLISGVGALVEYFERKRENARYSAEAYQQLHDRQEFRRIIEEYDRS